MAHNAKKEVDVHHTCGFSLATRPDMRSLR